MASHTQALCGDPAMVKAEVDDVVAVESSLASGVSSEIQEGPNNLAEHCCPQCGVSCSTLEAFIAHMRLSHFSWTKSGPTPTTVCPICGEVLSESARERAAHVAAHVLHSECNYACRPCSVLAYNVATPAPALFTSVEQFKQHFASSHVDLVYRCRECLKLSISLEHMREHSTVHAVEKERIRCILCGSVFSSLAQLTSHVETSHSACNPSFGTSKRMSASPRCSPKEVAMDAVSAKKDRKKAAGQIKCSVCDAKFSCELAVDEHKLVHHSKVVQSDRCMLCHEFISTAEGFIAHSKMHIDENSNGIHENSCIMCRQPIRGIAQLSMHADFHMAAANKSDAAIMEQQLINVERNFVGPRISIEAIVAGQSLLVNSEKVRQHVTGNEQPSFKSAKRGHAHSKNARLRCKRCVRVFSSITSFIAHRRKHRKVPKNVKCERRRQA